MTAKNRAALIGKLHTALKKHFKPAPPAPGRPLMEHVLYASLLEDSPADLADEGFAKCEQEFFDWNEVRVTTVTELAEVLNRLPNPQAAALRLKRNLQSIFETFYNFDIDFLKKENLGKAVAKFESMPGISPFVLSYVVQHGLGGHAIPVDKSSMKLMWLCGIVSDSEAESGKVPGIERTIPKNKSIEFSSLLHQAGIAFQSNSKDKTVWDVLSSVNKDAKALFDRPAPEPPKSEKRSAAKAKPADSPASGPADAASKSDKSDGKSKPATSKAVAPEAPAKGAAKPMTSKASPEKPTASKASAEKLPAAKPAAKPATEKPAAVGDKKTTSEKKPAAKPAAANNLTTKPASGKGAGTTKTPAPSGKSAKASEPAGKPVSSKTAAKKPEVAPKSATKKAEPKGAAPVKKPVTNKPAPAKPATSKSSVKKDAPEKGDKKPTPPSKKGASNDKAAVSSTNKKLTKQKPR